ncbi:MAG TPA: FAD-dependent monooxygenase [Stellaceae bacterium]|nr:FAD-dependent monooxygenase [Stellaceae bacterium]
MTAREPVIIVGAGPAGLTVAVSLALQGVPVIVLESEPELPRDLRAGSFHPPTVEMLGPLGIAEDFLSLGIRVARWQIRQRREIVVEWDLGLIADATPYPFRLHVEQYKLTPLLLRRLMAVGGAAVRFRHAFLDATQDADGVTARVETPGGIESLRGRYLVGADGGRSAVRHAMGVDFEGFTWPERFLVASTPYDLAPHGFTPNAYVSDPVEWAAIFKMPHEGPPGLWRVLVPTDPDMQEEALLDAAYVEQRLQVFLPRAQRYEVTYKSTYKVHQRVAREFRVGRMLLVGDAAHVNNPLGAFGLNGALHAAVNLGEKLGPVWRGEAEESLLDRYVRQRRHANIEFVQAQSIRNKELLQERDPAVRAERLAELRRTAADRTRAREFLLRSSMIASVLRAAEVA